MRITVTTGNISNVVDELIVIPCIQFEKEVIGTYSSQITNLLKEALPDSDFKGKENKIFYAYTFKKIPAKRIILVGLGEKDKITQEKIRRALSSVISCVKNNKMKIKSLSVEFPDIITDKNHLTTEEIASAIVEGTVLTNYSFNKYKTEDKKERVDLERFTVIANKNIETIKQKVQETILICNNICSCRNIINENASIIYPESFTNHVKKTLNGLKITVLDEKKIHSEGLGLLEAVGIGSIHPPRLVIIEYIGDSKSKKTTVLVGKGITYDTGGYNLKPTGGMETMKMDMSGAATVLYTIKTLRDLKIKVNVVGLMSMAENVVSDRSYKPGDVFVSYSGKSVEIGNTDAEGRLVLADAIAYSKKFNPDTIIDLATLTGACVVGLGEHISGLFTDDNKLAEDLTKSSSKTFDRVWRLQMYDEVRDLMKSDIADLKNSGSNRYGGAIQGAVFLQKFVPEGAKWAHLDIAGPAFLAKANFYNPIGASGHGVRLLVEYFRSQN